VWALSLREGGRERERENSNAMMLLFSFGPTFFEECSSGVIVNCVHFFENFMKTFPILTVVWFELTNKKGVSP